MFTILTPRRNGWRTALTLCALAGAALLLSAPARADGITWTLNGVQFADGGTAAGTFTYDAPTEIMSTWSITVSGGNTSTFPALTYTPSNSRFIYIPFGLSGFSQVSYQFTSNTFYPGNSSDLRFLSLNPASPLTNAGGAISLLLSDPYSLECYNCYPSRFITAGSLSASPVPEPATLLLWATGLLGLGGLGLCSALRNARRIGSTL